MLLVTILLDDPRTPEAYVPYVQITRDKYTRKYTRNIPVRTLLFFHFLFLVFLFSFFIFHFFCTRNMQGIVGQASHLGPSKCILWAVASDIDIFFWST